MSMALPFLCIRRVLLCFHLSGVQPVAHMMTKSLCISCLTCGGSILMTSLTTSSGPGALPLPRRLQQSNTTRSSRWLSSHCLVGWRVASVCIWNRSCAPGCAQG